jgi:hypothetical protein
VRLIVIATERWHRDRSYCECLCMLDEHRATEKKGRRGSTSSQVCAAL